MQIVSFGVMGFDYIKLAYCSFCDDLSLTSFSGLCKKKMFSETDAVDGRAVFLYCEWQTQCVFT